jgi:hypothetical protein
MTTRETLEVFRKAIPEFHGFIEEARALFAPLDEPGDPGECDQPSERAL